MGFKLVDLCVGAVVCLAFVCGVISLDLKHTEITTVTNETRYMTLHPDTKLVLFQKENNAKGNIIFTAGEHIDGDRLILTYMEETQYTRDEDIEVLLSYPAEGTNGLILSFIQIYTDLSTTTADAAFIAGGIRQTHAEMLLAANKTSNFGYQIYMYGY